MNKKILTICLVMVLVSCSILVSCKVDVNGDLTEENSLISDQQQSDTPYRFSGEPFTFKSITRAESSNRLPGATCEPSDFLATLQSDESASEDLKVTLPATVVPKRSDVLFAFDATGSMVSTVREAVSSAQDIMNNIRDLIPDSHFGLISNKDYPVDPFGNDSDYPYKLHKPIGTDDTGIQSEMNNILSNISGGGDGPESYTRAFYEAYMDSSIGWRDTSKKFLIIWLDNLPHPKDPGRDGVPNTEDDLVIDDVLTGLKDNNITLITLTSNGSNLDAWKNYSKMTGGDAFVVDSDTSIASFVADKIKEQVKQINKLSFEVHEPEFKTWFSGLDPEQYDDIILDSDKKFDFTATYTVPSSTPDGNYEFHLDLIGDGAVYATHKVTIKVQNNLPPVAKAGDDVIVEQESKDGTQVSLSGSESFDPENDEITYHWEWDGGSADGVDMSAIFPAGTTEVTLTVSEKEGGKSSTDTVSVTVQDTTAPTICFQRYGYWCQCNVFDGRYIFVGTVFAEDTISEDLDISVNTIQKFYDGSSQEGECEIDSYGRVYIQLPNDGKPLVRNFFVTITVKDEAGNIVTHEEAFTRF